MQNHGISKASAMDTRCLCINSLWPYDIICSRHSYQFGGQLHFQFPALEVTAPDNVIYKLRRKYTKTRPTLSPSIGLYFWRVNNIQVSLHVPYRVWSSWRKGRGKGRIWYQKPLWPSVARRCVIQIRNPIWVKASLLLWFRSYLSDRNQNVVIGNDSPCIGKKNCWCTPGLGNLQNRKYQLKYPFADDMILMLDSDDKSEAVDLINRDLDDIKNE